jgi:hypothetical protein
MPPDRPAPRAFYLAIARLAVWASPFLRSPSLNCDRTKNQTNTPAADRSQVCCSRYAESLVDRTGVTCRQIERSQDAEAAAAMSVVCRTRAGRRRADRSRSDVVMSGVVDSGRESGHGNIDANDPTRTLPHHKIAVRYTHPVGSVHGRQRDPHACATTLARCASPCPKEMFSPGTS